MFISTHLPDTPFVVYAYGEKAPEDFVPPASYPKSAVHLYRVAEVHGWLAAMEWHRTEDECWLTVHVARKLKVSERLTSALNGAHGPHWKFGATWHSRHATRPGTLKMFGRVLGETPDHPVVREYDSVVQVERLIQRNPVTKTV